jgi:hypothetical protein
VKAKGAQLASAATRRTPTFPTIDEVDLSPEAAPPKPLVETKVQEQMEHDGNIVEFGVPRFNKFPPLIKPSEFVVSHPKVQPNAFKTPVFGPTPCRQVVVQSKRMFGAGGADKPKVQKNRVRTSVWLVLVIFGLILSCLDGQH